MSQPPVHAPDYTRVPTTRAMVGDTLWNLVGMGVPMVAGAIAFPLLLNERFGLGKERLEILGLVWMLVGFSSIFDLGLGRALTKIFADKLSRRQEADLPGLFWTALAMIFALGAVTGLIILALIPLLAGGDLAPVFRAQTRHSFMVVACAMPIVVLNVGLVGVLQAARRFRLINLIRIPAGSFTFLGPLCVLPFTRSILAVVVVLVAGRTVAMVAYLVACLKTVPVLRRHVKWEGSEAKVLIGFGSWMTVSNVAVPFMTHINRFVIRTLCKIGEGTYYLIPEEMVVRLLMFARAWLDVLFPAFVTSFNSGDDAGALLERGIKYLVLVTFPICLAAAVFAPDLFCIWLPDGAVFAEQSAFVMTSLTIGIFVHGAGRMVWFFVQAAGRPDISARVHLVQLPLYLGAAYWLVSRWGVNGAAVAWCGRMALDFVVLLLFASRYTAHPRRLLMHVLLLVGGAGVLIGAATVPGSLAWRTVAVAGIIAGFGTVSWFGILSADERDGLIREGTRFLQPAAGRRPLR